jgi:hypothetical protein
MWSALTCQRFGKRDSSRLKKKRRQVSALHTEHVDESPASGEALSKVLILSRLYLATAFEM